MRAKLMTSAAVLLGTLAFASVGYAQSHSTGPTGAVGGNTHATDSYNSGHNDNSTYTDNSQQNESELKVEDSYNNNSRTETENKVEDSHNNNSRTETENKIEDSFNTDNSSRVENEHSFNTDSSSRVENEHSYNADESYNTDESFNTDNSVYVDDSFNTDSSTNDSFNDYSSHDSWNIRVSLNLQDLDASVSDIGFDQSERDDGSQHGHMTTGDISQHGGAFAGFAGIQTVSNNTGMASIGQAATAVSANANVTFGSGGGGI